MAELIYRLPGAEPYSYVEVKVDSAEVEGPGGDVYLLELLTNAKEALDQVFPAGAGRTPEDARPAAPAVSNGAQTTCVHGARTRVAKGNWVAWFCPEKDKSAQCKAEFEKK